MSGRYDRRPVREWEREPDVRSARQQIGTFRLIGFVALLAGSYLVFQGFGRDKQAPGTTPSAATQPRIAIDAALAQVMHDRQPYATLVRGDSALLLKQLRDGLKVDAAVLESGAAVRFATQGRCTDPVAIGSRGSTRYAACMVNVDGARRAMARRAIAALVDLRGREALLGAGFDVPPVRPTTP